MRGTGTLYAGVFQVVGGKPHRGHAMARFGLGLGPVVMPWGQQVRAVTVTLNLGREGTPLQAAGLTSCHTFGLAYGLVAYQAPRAFHQEGVSTETLGWGEGQWAPVAPHSGGSNSS